MFDGVKIEFTDKEFVNRECNSNLLNCVKNVDVHGEIKSYTASYNNLNFQMHPNGYTTIKGSLHKYFNKGTHNANDFDYKALISTINNLNSEFGLTPNLARISNLEYGVNIKTLFEPNELLNSLIYHKDKQFNLMKVLNKGNGRSCSYNQYEVKIYDKGLQYNLSERILRVEKKVTKMTSLKYKKIYLSDLLNKDLWHHCKAELLTMTTNLIIGEKLNKKSLSPHESFVYSIVPNKIDFNFYNRNQKSRYKNIYNSMIDNYGTIKFKQQLLNLVDLKCRELINT